MHEFLVFILFWVIALTIHEVHKHYKAHAARKAIAKVNADALNIFSPLHVEAPAPGLGKRHVVTAVIAAIAHPATAESLHHYIVHFVIYSGNIIK